jgi:hypothetical protein
MLLGHSSIVMTLDIYGHLFPRGRVSAIIRPSRSLRSPAGSSRPNITRQHRRAGFEPARGRPVCCERSRVQMLARGDRTAWLRWSDSNSEMSSQNIPLKARTDFQESADFWQQRLFAFELRGCGDAARA